MLRLKRLPSDKVSIVVRERTSPSKRVLGRAFGYSLLIHLSMCVLFQIQTTYFDNSVAVQTPTVFLDPDEGSVAVLTNSAQSDDDPRHGISMKLHLCNSSISTSIHAVSPSQADLSLLPVQEEKEEFLPISILPWGLDDDLAPSHHLIRVYPVKITLHHDLRPLILTDDGAYLFKKASFATLFSTPLFSETQPKVEFKVEVCAETGAILESTCLRELFDKRLQAIAESLVKSVHFAPVVEATSRKISGILALQFAGTYETIHTLLVEPENVS
jgi:hypothetical protein